MTLTVSSCLPLLVLLNRFWHLWSSGAGDISESSKVNNLLLQILQDLNIYYRIHV